MNRIFLTTLIAGCTIATATAQERETSGCRELPRPVVQEYRLEVGRGNALASYLSPLNYDGNIYGISGKWSKASRLHPESMVMNFDASFYYRSLLNPAHTAAMPGLDGSFAWGLSWRRRLPASLQLTAGGSLMLNGGALYLTRNGNNPVNASAAAALCLDASLSWRFRIGKVPMILADEMRLPSLGCFFAPEYGETYYEIWLGNRHQLAHCGWWGNRFCFNNLLSLRLDLGRTAMEVGYRYAYDSAWANSLLTRTSAHTFVIGVIPHGLSLKSHRPVNSPLY